MHRIVLALAGLVLALTTVVTPAHAQPPRPPSPPLFVMQVHDWCVGATELACDIDSFHQEGPPDEVVYVGEGQDHPTLAIKEMASYQDGLAQQVVIEGYIATETDYFYFRSRASDIPTGKLTFDKVKYASFRVFWFRS